MRDAHGHRHLRVPAPGDGRTRVADVERALDHRSPTSSRGPSSLTRPAGACDRAGSETGERESSAWPHT
jgi:hypothetical protein